MKLEAAGRHVCVCVFVCDCRKSITGREKAGGAENKKEEEKGNVCVPGKASVRGGERKNEKQETSLVGCRHFYVCVCGTRPVHVCGLDISSGIH